MTEKEFWRYVPKTGWKFRNNAPVKGIVRRQIEGGTMEYCPITAVAHRKLGKVFPQWRYQTAALVLGLNLQFAGRVALAADGLQSPTRQKLLKHVGLA